MKRALSLRIALGLLFFFSGGSRVLEPYQNFLYVVESYRLFPPGVETAAARLVPWLELFLGIFLLLGLWLKRVLQGYILMFTGFIAVIGQALLRQLPLEDCGCFGQLVQVPPRITFIFDILVFGTLLWLYYNREKAALFSLDRYFEKSS